MMLLRWQQKQKLVNSITPFSIDPWTSKSSVNSNQLTNNDEESEDYKKLSKRCESLFVEKDSDNWNASVIEVRVVDYFSLYFKWSSFFSL